MRGKNLDGDDALEPCIQRAIHLAHAASSKRGLDLVGSEFGASDECHPWASLYSCATRCSRCSDSRHVAGDPGGVLMRRTDQ